MLRFKRAGGYSIELICPFSLEPCLFHTLDYIALFLHIHGLNERVLLKEFSVCSYPITKDLTACAASYGASDTRLSPLVLLLEPPESRNKDTRNRVYHLACLRRNPHHHEELSSRPERC